MTASLEGAAFLKVAGTGEAQDSARQALSVQFRVANKTDPRIAYR